MDEYMKKLMAELAPPIPGFKLPNKAEETEDSGARADDAEEGEITEEALDESEKSLVPEDERDHAGNLGIFNEKDYAERIAGWEFKSEDLYVEGVEGMIEVYYRRRLASPAGTRWERIGHERSPDALELRRLLRCAELRDARVAEERERRRLIEGLFGAGSVPLVESLIALRLDEPRDAPLTPRQEAFCRHYLTEPSGARAAIVAGYSESGAKVQAHRLLTNANVLQKISALRRAHTLAYTLDRDTMLDKLEAFFEDAMKAESYSAALRALLAQAELSGLLNRRHKASERAETRARAAGEANGAGASQAPERER